MSAREVPAGADSNDDSQPTVLVVEDEPKVAEVYEKYLIEDYDVRVAHNGAEALVEFDAGVDVVLLDRRMPGMSGDEVLEHLRDWSDSCYIAMVTAVDPESDIVGMPFDDYLTKPVSRDEILGTIEQLLLIDRYESLLKEYHAVTRKMAAFNGSNDEDSRVQELEDRRADLLDDMKETVASFEDESVAEAFRELHGIEPDS